LSKLKMIPGRMPKNVKCPNCSFCGNYGNIVVYFSTLLHNPELRRFLYKTGKRSVGSPLYICGKCYSLFYYDRNERKWKLYAKLSKITENLMEWRVEVKAGLLRWIAR